MGNMQSQIIEAIEKSKKWAETGWEMTFGFNNVKVCSIEDSKKLADNFVFKIESLGYWNQVQDAGQEAAVWGEKALEEYKKGNMKAASDALYQAYYIEKFYEKYTKTWKKLALK